jgi:hypothetical protein
MREVPKSSQSSFTLDAPDERDDECRRRWCVTVFVNLDCACDCLYNDKFVNSSVQLVVNSAQKYNVNTDSSNTETH